MAFSATILVALCCLSHHPFISIEEERVDQLLAPSSCCSFSEPLLIGTTDLSINTNILMRTSSKPLHPSD